MSRSKGVISKFVLLYPLVNNESTVMHLFFQKSGRSSEFPYDTDRHLHGFVKDLIVVYDQIHEVEKKNAKSTILRFLRLIDKEKKHKRVKLEDKIPI